MILLLLITICNIMYFIYSYVILCVVSWNMIIVCFVGVAFYLYFFSTCPSLLFFAPLSLLTVGWSGFGRFDGLMRREIQFRFAGHITPWVLRIEW